MPPRTLAAAAAFELMQTRLVDAGRQLFDDCGVGRFDPFDGGIEALEGADRDLGAATIGFTAAGLRGAIVLVAPVAAIATWRRDRQRLDEPAIHDTVAEFANMLLGQLKRRLLRQGIELQMATPTAFSARGLSLPEAPRPHSRWQSLATPEGPIAMRLDVEFDEPEVGVREPHGAAPAEAGEVMFF